MRTRIGWGILGLGLMLMLGASSSKAQPKYPERLGFVEKAGVASQPLPQKFASARLAKEPNAPAAEKGTKAKPKSVWDSLPATKPGDVKLLSAGAEPRKALRYQFAKGAGGDVKLTTRAELSIEAGGRTQQAGFIPRFEMTATLTAKDKNPQGKFLIDILGKQPKIRNLNQLPKQLQDQLLAMLKQVPDVKGVSEVDERGIQSRLTFESVKMKNLEVQQMLQSFQANLGGMSAPLPVEAIGVGAKWLVNSSVMQAGMVLTQLTVFELIAFDGQVGRALVEVRHQAPKGGFRIPGLPPEVKTELTSMVSKGEGETYFDLKSPVPKGRMRSSARMVFKTTQDGATQDVSLRVKSLLRFRPPGK